MSGHQLSGLGVWGKEEGRRVHVPRTRDRRGIELLPRGGGTDAKDKTDQGRLLYRGAVEGNDPRTFLVPAP